MDNEDYDVGYKKPPVHTRFKKGQSGNPKGKAKGTNNFSTDLNNELKKKIEVNEGGRTKLITKQQGIIKQLTMKALMGETGAIHKLAELALKTQPAEEKDQEELSIDEEELMKAFIESIKDGSHE